jgi:uncharacterized protein YecE (DUF72 family)
LSGAEFWIGTSGWSYKHWRGRFYPEELPSSKWFPYYFEHFRTVELNASFYRLPQKKTWSNWQATAPQGFCFAVKASRFLTHIKRLEDCEEAIKRFFEGATLLKEKLGPILYQLPPFFGYDEEHRQRLEDFLTLLPPEHQHVFEFRHTSWFQEDVYDLLRKHKVAFCSYDMVGKNCPLLATTSFAYMRFHGTENRYASNYTDEMLKDWAKRLKTLAQDCTSVYVYFNNDHNACAVENAKRLIGLLSD